jgi:CRP-like cAMP-binding protein
VHTVSLGNGNLLPLCARGRVYFPGSGACSILSRMSDGSTIEVASVGNEGAVGVPALGCHLTESSYVQVAHGTLEYMAMSTFEEVCSDSEFGHVVDRYCAEFMRSVMHLVACNRMHSVEARCARWILLTYDRIQRAKFELTQPFLAMAIGTKHDEVSRLMSHMSERGVVKHDGDFVTIVDPIALRRVSCRCYETLRAGLDIPLVFRHRSPERRPSRGHKDNVVAMPNIPVCSLCGLGRNYPHKTFEECLRVIDLELRDTTALAKQLLRRRQAISHQWMEKYDKFRCHS